MDTQPKQLNPYPETTGGFGLTLWCLKALAVIFIMTLGASYGMAGYKIFTALFSMPALGISGLMLVSFLAGIPLVIGLLIGFLTKRKQIAGLAGSSILSVVTIVLFIFAAGAILREGIICIVMAAPIFMFLAIIGVIAGALLSLFGGSHSPKLLSIVMVLPLFVAPAEQRLPLVTAYQVTTQSIYINAPAETIWQHINFPLNIQPNELKDGFVYRIGAPHPIEARTLDGKVGGLRTLLWERRVKFEAIITTWEPNRHIAWNYKFEPDSFPPGSLDEHIVIGGHYFNLIATSYTLTPADNGTRLTIKVDTSVTTNFNWYADFLAQLLVNDVEKAFLQLYKTRSEIHHSAKMENQHANSRIHS